jgi:uncharacterized protein (DUF2141 family)
MKYPLIFSLLLCLLTSVNLRSQEVEVTVINIRNPKGQIVIGAFRDDPSFQKEEPPVSKKFVKKDIVTGQMTLRFSLEPGLWGLSLLDDENMTGLMEYNFLGIPKEGFGFSDYYHTGLTKPKFSSFSFNLEPGQKKKITIKVRYM